jgi:hypothetical protein
MTMYNKAPSTGLHLRTRRLSQVAEISGGVLLRMPHMVAVEGARPMLACVLVEFLVTGGLESHPQYNLNVLIQLRTLNCPLERTLGYSLTPAQRNTCSENHPSHRVTKQREPGNGNLY